MTAALAAAADLSAALRRYVRRGLTGVEEVEVLEALAAALDAHHQRHLREALAAMLNDCPPRELPAAFNHYRALALALAQDDHAGGLTGAYRAGVAAGIAEGKRRVVARLEEGVNPPPGTAAEEELYRCGWAFATQIARDVSVEP